jgi:hypothetical protein
MGRYLILRWGGGRVLGWDDEGVFLILASIYVCEGKRGWILLYYAPG